MINSFKDRTRQIRRWCFCLLLLAGCLVTSHSLAGQEPTVPLHTPDGFSVPQPGHQFQFPKDHGSHPGFKVEWWYVTGHLFSDDGRRFGFQATFFRRATSKTNELIATDVPGFHRDQIYLAHATLLDVKTGRFIHQERLNRGGWDADSNTNQLNVRNGNWSLRMPDTNSSRIELQCSVGAEVVWSLDLEPAKPLVVFGENGISRKAAEPTAASYYLTYPRLKATGQLRLGNESLKVHGQAWMDHEISSSQLGANQAGWDWVCIQLKDGREIMAYRMRNKDGSTDPYSTLAWISREGQVRHFNTNHFSLTGIKNWKSPSTGASYPCKAKLSTKDPQTGRPISFTIEPLALNQELTDQLGEVSYWEGACRVLDEKGVEVGSAYMELTGYAADLGERFK